MKDFMQGVVWAMLLIFVLGAGVREMLIHNGKLTSDLDAAGHTITNLPPGFHRDPEAYTKAETDARIGEAKDYADGAVAALSSVYFPLDGGTVNGGVSVEGNATVGADLSVSGDAYLKGANIDGGELRFRQYPGWDYVDTVITSNGVSAWRWLPGNGGGAWINYTFNWWELLKSESDPTVSAWAKASTKPSYGWSEITGKPSFSAVATSGSYNDLSSKPSIPSTPSDIGAADGVSVSVLSQNVVAVSAYLNGDDVRDVVTNYDSSVNMPSRSLEQRVDEGGSNYWRVIWNELTRWNRFTGDGFDWSAWCGFMCFRTNILAQLDGKADRAWGYYDSHGGAWAPDGYTWLSSPKIAIAAGMAYQRIATSNGAVWVLESNGLVTETGGVQSNGFFRISDDEGNSMFEIVKGNKRTVGATASGITVEDVMGVAHMHIPYNVESAEHPTVYVCASLASADWQSQDNGSCIANVSWTGSSGAWVAEVWGKTAQPSMFVKAEYETGGETYIKHTAPTGLEGGIMLNGTRYSVGTAVISGKTVLTLEVP